MVGGALLLNCGFGGSQEPGPGSTRPESAGAPVKSTGSDPIGLARARDRVSDELPGGAEAAAGLTTTL